MVSTTTFGQFPGVQVETAGGSLTGVTVGREQKVIVAGYGNPAEGSASVNEPTQISSRVGANRKFGGRLADQIRDALGNGANINLLYGLMLDEAEVTAEEFAGSGSGELANAPIKEDLDDVSVADTADSTDSASDDFRVEFVYESAPSPPTLEGTETDAVAINPNTGEWAADSESDYEFDYVYGDWESALGTIDGVLNEGETGVIAAATDAESVATSLSGTVNTLRGQYKMVVGVAGAQPDSTSEMGYARYDTSAYADAVDNDSVFLHAPARKEESVVKTTGALAGVMAGNALDDSIYRDVVSAGSVGQRLSLAEATNLRDSQVIPLRQPPAGGSVVISGNISSSTEEDYERDYFTRRIVDQAVLIARGIGQQTLGQINNQDTRGTAGALIRNSLTGLVNDGLLESDDGTPFVDVFEVDNKTIGIDIGITPFGVAKRVEVSITVDR